MSQKTYKENDCKSGFYSNERFDFDNTPKIAKTKSMRVNTIKPKKDELSNNESLSEGYHYFQDSSIVNIRKQKNKFKATQKRDFREDGSPEPASHHQS